MGCDADLAVQLKQCASVLGLTPHRPRQCFTSSRICRMRPSSACARFSVAVMLQIDSTLINSVNSVPRSV